MNTEFCIDTVCPKDDQNTGGTLAALRPGEQARVCNLGVEGALRRRLLDLGLVQNTVVKCVGVSPSGDPAAYLIRGAVIALRAADTSRIAVKRGDALWG